MDENIGIVYFALRICVGAVMVFLLSVMMSCREVKYAVWGKTARAHVTKTYEERGRHGEKLYVVMYRFKDDAGEDRLDGFRLHANPGWAQGTVVPVDYLRDSSRAAGEVQWIWPGILVGSLALAGLAALPLILEARRETSPSAQVPMAGKRTPPRSQRLAGPR